MSLTAVQTCLLLSIVAFAEGEMVTESLYGALAIRMIQLMDIPNRVYEDEIQKEVEVRGTQGPCHDLHTTVLTLKA